MATTGTTSVNLDLNAIVEEAFERCGREVRTGYDMKTARRSLNLLMMEWSNRGINLWTVEEGSIPLVAGTATYDLPADTVDLMDQVIRTGSGTTQSDINISRISVSTYATIPNKTSTGRPIQLWINRLAAPTVTVWPVPDSGDYTMLYWRLRRIEDAGDGLNTQDVPYRFLPCLVSGLAYNLSLKLPGALERSALLKQEYIEQWGMAADEDREKATLRIVPHIGR